MEQQRQQAVNLEKEYKRVERIADLFVEHQTNEKGEALAHIQANQAFQEIYDFRGADKRRWRLDRKKEWVQSQYDSASQLFQKVYYAKDLTHEDEITLRKSFNSNNAQHEYFNQVATAGLFLAFWPVTYRLARQVRPGTVAVFAGAYYFGLYKQVVLPTGVQRFQSSLNASAVPLAAKYGIQH